MKTRIFTMLALVTSLALLLAASTSAQRSDRPIAPPSPGDLGPQSVNAPAVTLGQPGLSFRYVQTFGVTEEPYPADAQHLNGPNGMFIDSGNNLYVVEERGYRLLKYNSSGGNVIIVGRAGLYWSDYLMWPKDVAVAGDGHIWVAMENCLKEFNATGAEIQMFPDVADPWNAGSDNERFNDPRGVAFDSAGRMHVADRYNHRVQVYTFTVDGGLVYSTTIGVTGVSGSDNDHFNEPHQIVIDGSDRLYVADAGNYRVQRCTYSSGWTCTTFHGTGSAGSGANELDQAFGLGIDDSENVYIADGNNGRVKRCTSGGGCSTFVSGLLGLVDVAVDTTGNVYINDDHAIRKYNGNGVFQTVFAGTIGVPYVTDTARYNAPWGIAVATDDSIYFIEQSGYRLVKLDAAGVQQWTVGEAGVWGSDNAHLGSSWAGPQGNPAVDSAGRIYVPDTGNDRIQIFNSNGAYFTTFGSSGTGNYQFSCPSGVAISPVSGDIYVTDSCNQRIMVYDSSRVYKARLGVTGVTGSDNTRFNNPRSVAVDASGNIFVADTENRRVQKCTLSGSNYTCTTFAGVTGECGDDFDHLCGPTLAVDASGRVYVADKWGNNNRVQVFDSTGAYLTTLGGAWGANSGQMRDPSGVAVDSAGNVYVTDGGNGNHRIQKFAPGVPGWKQANINGFGERNNWAATRMSVFNGYLYASAANSNTGGEVWRTNGGPTWTQVNLDGFGVVSNTMAPVGEAFNGYLYAGTANSPTGAEIWRCATCDGTDWTRVITGGFDDGNNNTVQRILVFSNTLYATIDNSATGVEVWKSPTGNPGSWTQSNVDGFGDANNTGLYAAAVFDGYLYAATAQWGSTHTGVEVWRTRDGVTWSQVNPDGFGDPENRSPWLEPFNGYLYLLSLNFGTGAQVWRCAICDNTDWERVIGDGFGDSNNAGGGFMLGFGNYFYAFTSNNVTGTEAWRTVNGTNWSQVSVDGLGDSNNGSVVSGAVINNRFFIGTWNDANGGEVWQMLHQVYLPVVLRD